MVLQRLAKPSSLAGRVGSSPTTSAKLNVQLQDSGTR